MAEKQPKEASPEKKLLKIIEGQAPSSEADGPVVSSAAVREYRRSGFDPAVLIANASAFIQTIKTRSSGVSLFALDLRTLNNLAILIVAGLVIAIIANVVGPRPDVDRFIALAVSSPGAQSATDRFSGAGKSVVDIKDRLDVFLYTAGQRNFFKPLKKKELAAPAITVGDIAPGLPNIALVGISYSDTDGGSYVMLEDGANKATTFAKQGEQVQGVLVKEIQPTKVILVYQGKEYELR